MIYVSEIIPNTIGYGSVGSGNCAAIESGTHNAGFGGSSLGTNSADVIEVWI